MIKQRFNPKWEKCRNEYIDYCIGRINYKNEASKVRSYYDYKTTINQLYDYLWRIDIKDLKDITTETLINFQKYLYIQMALIPRTIKKKFAKLRLYFVYLVTQGKLESNPFNKVQLLPGINPGRIQIKRYYSIDELIDRYNHLLKKVKRTILSTEQKNKDINLFVDFLYQRQDKTSLYKVTEEDIVVYREYLKHYQYEPGRNYCPHNQIRALRSLKQFFRYIYMTGYLPRDPMEGFNCKEHIKELESYYNISLDTPDPEKLIPPEIKIYRDKFIEYLIFKGYSKRSVETFKVSLKTFTRFLGLKGIDTLAKIDKAVITEYQDYLKKDLRTKEGKNFCTTTIAHKLMQLEGFLRFLVRKEYINTDYTVFIDIPRIPNGLPNSVMTEREINLILATPDPLTTVGLRDKAVLETLYSTGVRASELANVKIDEVDLEGGLIRVNVPKGGEDYQRVVPIGRIACDYIKKYIKSSRPELLRNKKDDNGYLILTTNGNKTNNHIINNIVRKYAYITGIRKHITPHSFRATCATLMLTNDADIRFVQEQLGHKSIRSTQIYTRLVPKDLKKIHQQCHPREKQYNTDNRTNIEAPHKIALD